MRDISYNKTDKVYTAYTKTEKKRFTNYEDAVKWRDTMLNLDLPEPTWQERLFSVIVTSEKTLYYATKLTNEQIINNIEELVSNLTPREEAVIKLRFSGKSLEDTGKELNCTRERVRQIESKALSRLVHFQRHLLFDYTPEELKELQQKYDAQARLLEEAIAKKREEYFDLLNKSPVEVFKETSNDLLLLEDVPLSCRTYNCLKRAGIRSLYELVNYTEEDMLHIRNLGRKSMKEVVTLMHEYNLKLKEDIDIEIEV